MTKYNEFEIEFGGVQYVFVTRGRSKKIEAEEALEYLATKTIKKDGVEALATNLGFPNKPVMPTKDATFSNWSIPDDRMRRHMFQKDLQKGMKFCIGKYGQTEEAIESEARRLALGGF